jgi:acyl-CoA synthetase (AMP-forming)/AMP-acid ligase II
MDVPELWAALVCRPDLDVGALQGHCEGRLGQGFVPRGFVRIEQLPLNAAGKVDRQRLAELVRPNRP